MPDKGDNTLWIRRNGVIRRDGGLHVATLTKIGNLYTCTPEPAQIDLGRTVESAPSMFRAVQKSFGRNRSIEYAQVSLARGGGLFIPARRP